MKLPLLLALLASLLSVVLADDWVKPKFCRGLECPKFALEKDTKDEAENYQVRVYEKSKWVSTKVNSPYFQKAVSAGFMKLFAYISGSNAKNQKIEMTSPVSIRVLAGPGPACGSDFIVSFYIDEQVALDPPAPTDAEVFIEERPRLRVAVAEFGGYFNDYENKVVPVLERLAAAIQKRGELLDDAQDPALWVAGYDSPFRLFFRHNEVWLQLKDKPEDNNDKKFLATEA